MKRQLIGKNPDPGPEFTYFVIQPLGDTTDYRDPVPGKSNPIITDPLAKDADAHENTPYPFAKTNSSIGTTVGKRVKENDEGDDEHDNHPKHVVLDADDAPQIPHKELIAFRKRLRDKTSRKLKFSALKKPGETKVAFRKAFRMAVEQAAKESRVTGWVEHTDHHGFSPGMNLLEEVFTGMKSCVQGPIEKYNKDLKRTYSDLKLLCENLERFISVLNGVGLPNLEDEWCKKGILYRSFIACRLDHPEVESTRLLLRLEVKCGLLWPEEHEAGQKLAEIAPKIEGGSLGVGAWKGGTHSDGHSL